MKDGLLQDVQPGDLIVDLNQWYGIKLGVVFGETKIGRMRYIQLFSSQPGEVREDKTYAKENSKTLKVTWDEARDYIRRICQQKWRDEEGIIAERYIALYEELVTPNEV